MLSSFVTALVLAASPQLAMTSFSGVGVTKELQGYCSERVAAAMVARGLRVTTPEDIANVLGLERQRQLLGCDSETASSCAAELASALGAEAIVSGSVARLGSGFEVSVKVVSTATVRVLAQAQASATSENGLAAALEDVASQLAARLAPTPGPSRALTLGLPLGLSAAAVVVGVVLISTAAVDAAALRVPLGPMESPFLDGALRAQSIVTRRDLSLVSFGVALTSAAIGVVWTLLSGRPAEPVGQAVGGFESWVLR